MAMYFGDFRLCRKTEEISFLNLNSSLITDMYQSRLFIFIVNRKAIDIMRSRDLKENTTLVQ